MSDAQKAPERHSDKERNKILNAAVTRLDRIINQHDPEVDVPIKDGVWVHLDKVCASLEDRVDAERDALAAEVKRLREVLVFVDSKVSWEINPSNYAHQDVCGMNADWCEIGSAASAALEEWKD